MSDPIPNQSISAKWLVTNIRPLDDLEVLPIQFEDTVSDGDCGAGMVITVDGDEYIVPISEFESDAIDYLVAGFAHHSHLPNVYQMLISSMSMQGCTTMEYCIEAADGDVLYARLLWRDAKGRFFSCVTTAGEGAVIALYARAPMKIVKNVIDQLVRADDGPYDDEINVGDY